jgi:hypothetical protein
MRETVFRLHSQVHRSKFARDASNATLGHCPFTYILPLRRVILVSIVFSSIEYQLNSSFIHRNRNGAHRSFALDRRQRQFLHDLGILDRKRLLDRLALDPFGGERRGRNGRPTAEGFELCVFDDAGLRVDLDLQLPSQSFPWVR